MLKSILKCYGCKENFRREELVSYASANSNTFHNYCLKCLKEKQDRENFSNKVCQIFGLKAPGPRIWTERKRLQDKYGYTDNVIIDCLEYIYNVERKKKLADSLCLVSPITVNKMIKYKQAQETEARQIIEAMRMEQTEQIVSIRESNTEHKTKWNPDDYLDD